jgi:phosphoribosylamine-glycine ligase
MDLENRLFHGKMGPKISDVSQLIVAGVHPQWQARVVDRISKWVAEVKYVGWLDVDLMYNLETDEILCFEFMVRFSIPSISCVLKLGCCNWLDVFLRVSRGETVTQADFLWKHPWAVGVGLFSFSTVANSITGDIPTEAPVSNYEDYWREHPRDSNLHLIAIEAFDCSTCDVLELAGSDGRHFYAVGTGATWREALGNAYTVARTVDYPNKVYKVNLFGFDSPYMCDSNMDALLPTLVKKGVILL